MLFDLLYQGPDEVRKYFISKLQLQLGQTNQNYSYMVLALEF